ncbi:MAG: DarT ssDNA thymidine ADP-ribosyltransferase family protein [Thermodesulfobacteriota bacterium]|nr:DarT ssDNA thymidine ADP-ribosyltransferase family protein [Thermodesulfobacteriota bacterium]
MYDSWHAQYTGITLVIGYFHIKEWTFAEYWTDADQITEWQKKAAKCAEVLVPDKVEPAYITGAYVACQEAQAALKSLAKGVAVEINSHLFFR